MNSPSVMSRDHARCPVGCPATSSPTRRFPRPTPPNPAGRQTTYPCNPVALFHRSTLMIRPRISSVRLRHLAETLTPRYITPLPHLAHVRLLSGTQLDRLLAEPELSPQTTARVRRRIMARLTGLGLVAMLGRRIGGVRAGSAGHVYTLTTAGHRFLALLGGQPEPARKQPSHMPGDLFLTHTLTISGIYVDLTEYSRDGAFAVHTFTTEPHCWHPTGDGGYLRADAYVVLRAGQRGQCWWLEIDTGTETAPRLRAKARTYRDYLTSGGVGPDHVPPRVLFTTPDPQRADLITNLLTDDDDMISATTHERAAAYMIHELIPP